MVLLHGVNGVGKTNILEGLALLGKGGDLRKADFEDMINSTDISSNPQFSIYSQIENHQFINEIAINYQSSSKKKFIKVNGEELNSKRQNDVKNYFINFISLTPQLEQLFISGKSNRRDYLDKIVSDIDVNHNSRINNYQKLLKERLMILQKSKFSQSNIANEKWLSIIENQIVEIGVAIASARVEAIDFFNGAIATFKSNFPKPKLYVIGEIEEMIGQQPAVTIENFYKEKLKENRQIDLENFKTNFGVHRCDFDAIFTEKNSSAQKSSTGEQKAIMIGITIARAKIINNYKNKPVIMIFDEIVSHLDEKRKINLFDEIKDTSIQSFFSATSHNLLPEKYFNDSNLQKILI